MRDTSSSNEDDACVRFHKAASQLEYNIDFFEAQEQSKGRS